MFVLSSLTYNINIYNILHCMANDHASYATVCNPSTSTRLNNFFLFFNFSQSSLFIARYFFFLLNISSESLPHTFMFS